MTSSKLQTFLMLLTFRSSYQRTRKRKSLKFSCQQFSIFFLTQNTTENFHRREKREKNGKTYRGSIRGTKSSHIWNFSSRRVGKVKNIRNYPWQLQLLLCKVFLLQTIRIYCFRSVKKLFAIFPLFSHSFECEMWNFTTCLMSWKI